MFQKISGYWLEYSEDMKTLFDPVIADITSLLSEQVEEAKAEKDATIDVMISIPNKNLLLMDIKLTKTSN